MIRRSKLRYFGNIVKWCGDNPEKVMIQGKIYKGHLSMIIRSYAVLMALKKEEKTTHPIDRPILEIDSDLSSVGHEHQT